MKYLKYIIPVIFATVLLSCDKDLLETVPNDRISSAVYWQSDQDAIYAANAVYLYLEDSKRFCNWDAISDIGHASQQWGDPSFIEKGVHTSVTTKILSDWTYYYSGIQPANTFISNIDRVQTENQSIIDRLTGEVKVLRAYYYMKLAALYGDVPLITKPLTLDESKKLARTPVAEVWNFISQELTEAADLLPTSQTEKGRVTKGTALGLKSRALLYAGRFSEAAEAAKAVMDLGVHNLYPSYRKLFSYSAENNSEILLDKQFIAGVQSNDLFWLLGPGSIHPTNIPDSYVPTKSIVDAYQMNNGMDINAGGSEYDPFDPYKNRDPRLKYSVFVLGDTLPNGKIYDPRPWSGTGDAVGFSMSATTTGFNIKKYVNKEDVGKPQDCGINIILMRYAEVLLNYAEAKIEANSIDQSVLDAINAVRQRSDVHMPPLVGITSQNQLRQIVRNERKVELAFEGLRYFDIRRWKIAESTIPGIIYGMTYINQSGQLDTITMPSFQKTFNPNRDYLWPVPQKEIDLNPNLTQNPNW